MDEELLKQAKNAGERLKAAELETVMARAEYNTIVRRLHLSGASLREIGDALALSHQRVAQIVDAGGGSWWRRVWRTRNQRDHVCTFCSRPPSEIQKLIAGPDVFICDGCVALAEERLARGAGPLAEVKDKAKCSFCGKRAPSQRARGPRAGATVRGGDAKICAACLETCRQILDGRS